MCMTIPNVQEFERIEQHPFLHVVINLLIGPKAWSSIDLPERREEKHSKNILGFFFSTSSNFYLSSQFSKQKCYAITGVDLGHLWNKEICSHKKERKEDRRREKEMGKEGLFFPFKDTLELLALAWA